jgi:hypothetical protein
MMPQEEETKVCFTCKKEQPKSNFARNAKHKDGLSGKCKDCHRVYQRERLAALRRVTQELGLRVDEPKYKPSTIDRFFEESAL